MDLTRRCDYACRILRAASRHEGECISIAQISEEEDVPYAFARTIQRELSSSGYVKCTRGAHGGLTLSVDPSEVSMKELLQSVQGPLSIAPCVETENFCEKSSWCAFCQVWAGADRLLDAYFSQLTLEDVLDGANPKKIVDQAIHGVATDILKNEDADARE